MMLYSFDTLSPNLTKDSTITFRSKIYNFHTKLGNIV